MTHSKRIFVLMTLLMAGLIIIGYLLFSSNIIKNNFFKSAKDQVNMTPPPAVETLRVFVAFQNILDVEAVEVISFKEVDWTDSCLGLQKSNEICAAIIVPGYEVVLEVNNEKRTYRINSDAGIVREVIK